MFMFYDKQKSDDVFTLPSAQRGGLLPVSRGASACLQRWSPASGQVFISIVTTV